MVSQNVIGQRRASRSKVARIGIIAISLLAVGLGGCRGRSSEGQVLGWVQADPSARHPIIVSKAPVYLDIEVPRGSMGLTRSQKSAVLSFVAEYRNNGDGLLTISMPSGGGNESAAHRVAKNVRTVASNSGVSDSEMETQPYFVGGNASEPVKLTFTRHVAKAPQCGFWPESLEKDPRNSNYANFGCSQQANLAAMVANPRDLVMPRTMDPRMSERRDVHWQKHIAGETTGAKRSDDEKAGNISEVAKN